MTLSIENRLSPAETTSGFGSNHFLVLIMGLIGFFLNKTLLKILLIGGAAFLLLRFLAWFLSSAAGLGWVPLLGLIVVTLVVSKSLAGKNFRLRAISVSITLLSFTVLTFILVLNILERVQILGVLGAPIKLALASLPSLIYLAYRRNLWSWRGTSLFQRRLRHSQKLSLGNLLPKGIEEGHIAYSAGSRGFRVLKFIEVKQQFDGKENPAKSEQIRRQIATTLTKQLNTLRKLEIEISYELHCRNGTPRVLIASISEGRGYRRCRSLVDECSNLLARSMRPFSSTSISAKPLEESNRAKRALMMPTFANVEDITLIENDDYNVRLLRTGDQERRTKLRLIQLSNVQSLCLKNEANLLEELVHLAVTHRPIWDFTYILHIKPLPHSTVDEELTEISKDREVALMQVSQELQNGFLDHKKRERALVDNCREGVPNARQKVLNTDVKLERLRKTKESGYFEASITIVSEPTTAESIARKIKSQTPQDKTYAELCISLVPPQLLTRTIRRHPPLSSDRLTGEEIISLIQLPRDPSERQNVNAESNPMRPQITQLPVDIPPSPTKP